MHQLLGEVERRCSTSRFSLAKKQDGDPFGEEACTKWDDWMEKLFGEKPTAASRSHYLLLTGDSTQLDLKQLKLLLGRHVKSAKEKELEMNTLFGNVLLSEFTKRKNASLNLLDDMLMCRHFLEHAAVGRNSRLEVAKKMVKKESGKKEPTIDWQDSTDLGKCSDQAAHDSTVAGLKAKGTVELVAVEELIEDMLQVSTRFLKDFERTANVEVLKQKLQRLRALEGKEVALDTFVDPDDEQELGTRIVESARGYKERNELSMLLSALTAAPAASFADTGARFLVHGEQGQGKTMLAEAAFVRLQKCRSNYSANFFRFRASSEQGDAPMALAVQVILTRSNSFVVIFVFKLLIDSFVGCRAQAKSCCICAP
jgi:hypothetical protein